HARFPQCFFRHAPPPPELYSLSLHDALPICPHARQPRVVLDEELRPVRLVLRRQLPLDPLRVLPHRPELDARELAPPERLAPVRSEEHTSELQSRENLVCRLLLEKKKNNNTE